MGAAESGGKWQGLPLATPRLTLRPARAADAADIVPLAGDIEVSRTLARMQRTSRRSCGGRLSSRSSRDSGSSRGLPQPRGPWRCSIGWIASSAPCGLTDSTHTRRVASGPWASL